MLKNPGILNFTVLSWIPDMGANKNLKAVGKPGALCSDSPNLSRPCRATLGNSLREMNISLLARVFLSLYVTHPSRGCHNTSRLTTPNIDCTNQGLMRQYSGSKQARLNSRRDGAGIAGCCTPRESKGLASSRELCLPATEVR